MKDIKFRVWDVYLHEYSYSPVKVLDVLSTVWDKDFIVVSYKLEQYTGLKDKNGKEIYEGDIILNHNGYDHCDIKDIVIFENGKFTTHKKVANIKSYSESGTTYQVIVIGNIHENPELLGDE